MSAHRLPYLALVCILIAIAVVGFATSSAEAVIYWGSNSWIGAANTDGTMLLDSYPYGVAGTLPRAEVCGIAVNGTHLFWADRANSAVGRMELSNTPNGRIALGEPGVAIDQAFVSGLAEPCGVAVDERHLYWASTNWAGITGSVGRANLDGSAPEREFIAGLSHPCGVAVDSEHVYWGEVSNDSIGRAKLDGSEVEPEFITGAGHPCGVAVSGTHIYWSGEGPDEIGRADLDGSQVEPSFIPLSIWPCGVAVDAGHVYWADREQTGVYVSRANLDGSGAAPFLGEPSYPASCGVALDSRVFQAPLPLRSLPIRFGPLKRLKKGHVLVQVVFVPERGELTVSSPRLGWSLDKGPPPPSWRGGVFSWRLKLWPGRGPIGKRIRRQLQVKGRAPVDLNLSWEQQGRAAVLESKHLAFIDPR